MMMDTEPDIIENVAINGPCKNLFSIDYLEFGNEDARSVFSEA
jgi:hypothetical protein